MGGHYVALLRRGHLSFADLCSSAGKTPVLVGRSYLNPEYDLVAIFPNIQDLMPIDAAPGRDIVLHPRIGGNNLQDLTLGHLSNPVLGSYHGHRAKQVAGIELIRH
jgi:hypothetical protein